MPTSDSYSPIPSLTARIVAAFVDNNFLPRAELTPFIGAVHVQLSRLAEEPIRKPEPRPTPVPAVPVRKSITPDYLICLDDGLKLGSLKRHLAKLGMMLEQYRAKWDLPSDGDVTLTQQKGLAVHRAGFGSAKPLISLASNILLEE